MTRQQLGLWNFGIEVWKLKTACSNDFVAMNKQIDNEAGQKLIENFVRQTESELNQRWANWKTDFKQLEVHEVVGALVARQVTLAKYLAYNPSLWNWDIAPLFLRPMTEVYLNLAWIFANPTERSRTFILHGLGQMKLRVEHRKAAQKAMSPEQSETFNESVESAERWIDSQQYGFLTEVNLGNWAELNQRKMAEEIGELDFYNHCYTPYSAGVHSMWHHIGIYNLKRCKNPLHQFHKVPHLPLFDADAHFLILAGKYLQMVFDLFDEKTGVEINKPSAFQILCDEISKIAKGDDN
jgi:Family of unknown function (DUF5677)